eukprot:GHVU01187313.1.p1 GENE.GHVU01187313.1~~GHVU01187313.1.p1  ORF type:complete len:237 (+),score=43.97 GHVU01187313.1:35-745(+)
MEDETTYYWDDETQLYYYYDPLQEAYVPYVEEEGGAEDPAGAELEEGGAAATEGYTEEEAVDTEEVPGADETSLFGETRAVGEVPEASNEEPAFTRFRSRKFSLAEHGGLAGALAEARKTRDYRLKTGTSFAVDDESALLKFTQKMAEESRKLAHGELNANYKRIKIPFPVVSCLLILDAEEKEGSGEPALESQATMDTGSLIPRSNRRRSTNVRFGTVANSGHLKSAVEDMLGAK